MTCHLKEMSKLAEHTIFSMYSYLSSTKCVRRWIQEVTEALQDDFNYPDQTSWPFLLSCSLCTRLTFSTTLNNASCTRGLMMSRQWSVIEIAKSWSILAGHFHIKSNLQHLNYGCLKIDLRLDKWLI